MKMAEIPEGIKHIKYQCQTHLNNAGNDQAVSMRLQNGIHIEEHRGVAECTKPMVDTLVSSLVQR